VKPIDPHQDDSLTEDATEDDRFAALVAAEARGEPVSPGDAAFRRRPGCGRPSGRWGTPANRRRGSATPTCWRGCSSARRPRSARRLRGVAGWR